MHFGPALLGMPNNRESEPVFVIETDHRNRVAIFLGFGRTKDQGFQGINHAINGSRAVYLKLCKELKGQSRLGVSLFESTASFVALEGGNQQENNHFGGSHMGVGQKKVPKMQPW